MADPSEMDIDQKPPAEEQREETGALNAHPPETGAGAPAVRSIEGWIVLVTNVHEEASEEDLQDRFGEYGEIQNLHLNLDRRTGYVKGYALIEYSTLAEAREAISQADNTKLLEKTIYADYAFVRPPPSHSRGGGKASGVFSKRGGKSSGDRGGRGSVRSRSKSPPPAVKDDAEESTTAIPESLEDQTG